MVVVIILVVVILLLVISCVKVVPQAHAMVIEAFGRLSYDLAGRTPLQGAVY